MFDLGEAIVYLIAAVAVVVAYFYLRPGAPAIPPPPTRAKQEGPKPPNPTVKKTAGRRRPEAPADTKATIKILFGSQTGTADDFSHILEKEARRHKIFAQVIDLEEYAPDDLKNESNIIFVMATHGEGEPTDNAKDFYNWLSNKDNTLSEHHLSKLNYTIFGLGNKTYEQYNAVARFVDKKLQDLGANCIFEKGEGDDDCSLEEDFNKWKKRMWGPLCKHLGIEASDATEDDKFIPRFRMLNCPPSAATNKYHTKAAGKQKSKSDGSLIYDIKSPYLARIVVNRELHSTLSDRSCRHIELEIGDHLSYQPGDHLGVYPENSAGLVNQFVQRLGADPDAVVALVPIAQKSDDTEEAVLGPCTVRQAFIEAIDITTPPRKAVLHALADYATVPEEKKRLLLLSSEAGSEEYNKVIKNDTRTIFEVLVMFPSVNPPLAHMLEMLPRLAPRYYSISSSPNFNPGFVHITSVVVNFKTGAGRDHNGVCSSWLASLPVGTLVPAFVRESHFRIPPNPAPLVMIGPGTGLAPFRGFLQELSHRRNKGTKGYESALFFGCRDRTHDFIYEDELKNFHDDGTLSELSLAFSREQTSKVYVQNRMLENKQLIWDLIKEKRGYIYVCGDARQMAKAVHAALHNIAMENGNMTDQQANAFIEDLQKSGRYLQDVWF